MTYTESVVYLSSQQRFAGGPDEALAAMRVLMKKLGNPQNHLRVIHIAGTNGKGSVATFCSEILQNAGYRTGKYLSPYVLEFRERMQVNGKMIPKSTLAELATLVKTAADEATKEGCRFTAFHLTTAAAFCYFAREHCDFVCLEVGLGGKGDCTNIIPQPEVAVITPISLDHTAVLGNTVEEIAAEKAGILKKGSRLVLANQPEGAKRVIEQTAKHLGVPVTYPQPFRICCNTPQNLKIQIGERAYNIGMVGNYQAENAAVALAVVESLRKNGVTIPEGAVEEGFSSARIPARMERLCESPLFFLDGAHNPAGAVAAAEFAKNLPHPRILICAVMADKETAAITEALYPL